MKANEGKWALSILLLVILSFVLPFTLFREVAKWYGSFLWWIVLTVAVIVINYFLTKDWGKEE